MRLRDARRAENRRPPGKKGAGRGKKHRDGRGQRNGFIHKFAPLSKDA